jgi:hypothetical protein
MYSTQVEWFLANQRQTSYDPATQTPEQGALESAQDYAMAEAHADEHGWTLVYQDDIDNPGEGEYVCILIDALGNELTLLSGVEAEASAPWYRAIRAELALEVLFP